MKAIVVKYLSVTTTKPARFKAYVKGHSLTVSCYDEILEDWGKTPQRVVADMLMEKLDWRGVEIVGVGTLPNEDYVYILQLI